MNIINLLAEGETVAKWISTLMPILRSIFLILMIVCSLVVLIICLATESNAESGTNVITGSSYDSYFSQNRSSTREGRLKRLLIISSIIVAVSAVLYFVTIKIYPPIV